MSKYAAILFLLRFDRWLFHGSRREVVREGAGLERIHQFTSALIPWVDELNAIWNAGGFAYLNSARAAKLDDLINRAIAPLAAEYQLCEASTEIMMITLWPLKHIRSALRKIAGMSPEGT